MNYKFFVSLMLSVLITSAIFATEVNKANAEKVAVNAYFEKSWKFDKEINYYDINIVESYLVDDTYYVVNFSDGWVLISADDAVTPVLGYNLNGKFPAQSQMTQNLESWMAHFVDQKDFVNENRIMASEDIASQWNKYMSSDIASLRSGERDVTEPLCSSLWNQDDPYNVLCPADDAGPGGHVYVGCVATAMSQIMYYWRYPNQGSGSYSYYQYPYGVITANFDTTYNWDGMADVINNQNPWDIACIGFHAGVSVQMDYGADGSGSFSWDVPSALEDHFNYSSQASYIEKSNYSTSVWENYMQQDLDAGRPIYYSGFSSSGGHAFVCDAYDGDNNYHFNFGWSGSGNGFYTLQDVNGFNTGQGMVRNIMPGDANYPYIADGADTLFALAGSFTDGSGPIEDYPSGVDASWLIEPQTETDSVESITLSFTEFNTNSTDVVKVYGGNDASGTLLGTFSGSSLPSDVSFDGNELYITFTSSGSASGFKAEYTSSSPDWCSGSQTFDEPSGTLSDGSLDFNYNNNSTCIYVIQNPEAVKITLEFTSFATEEGFDKVTVFNESNQVIATLSGQELPDPIVEETGTMFITWNTNSTVRDAGWEADYYIDGVGVNENADADGISISPNPSNGLFNINLNDKTVNTTIKVMDMNGRIVYNSTLDAMQHTIDLTSEPKGIYLVNINSVDVNINKRIIVR